MHVIVLRRGQHYRQAFTGVGRVFVGYALTCAAALAAVLAAALAILAGPAAASAATKTVRYRGYAMRVPASWPVFHLSRRSTVCVRFNRHAVYLGAPGTRQACPANAAGGTEAILASPRATAHADVLAPVTAGAAQPARGSETQLAIPAHGLEVTATWNAHPGVVERALGGRLKLGTGAPASRPRPSATAARLASALDFRPMAKAAAAPGATGTVFTGLGFDACTAPSPSQMTAWGASPFARSASHRRHEHGVLAGKPDRHVGRAGVVHGLAPDADLRRAAGAGKFLRLFADLEFDQPATSQGTSAAIDAVTHAQAIGIGPGNPIYDDMEAYSNGGSHPRRCSRSCQRGPPSCTPRDTVPGLQQRRLGDRRSRRPVRNRLPGARRHLDRPLERRQEHQ